MALWLNLTTRTVLLIIGFIELIFSIIVDVRHVDTISFAYAGIVFSIFVNLCDVIWTCITQEMSSSNRGIMLTLDVIALGLLTPGFLFRLFGNMEYFQNTNENVASQWMMVVLAVGHAIMIVIDTAYCCQMMHRRSQQRSGGGG